MLSTYYMKVLDSARAWQSHQRIVINLRIKANIKPKSPGTLDTAVDTILF